ncbi:TonB-dependent receptor domain-containing protein [Hyphomonas pacifica]|nr:TonB-dependent receptor [Hyphomonas pacifica]
MTIDIQTEAGRLESALNALAEQTGYQIIVFSEDAGPHHSAALNGQYTLESALDALLAGTGLEYRFVNARTIAVAAPWRFSPPRSPEPRPEPSRPVPQPKPSLLPPPEPDRALRQAPVIVSALKRDEELQDVPAPITSFSAPELELSGLQNLRDVARLTPNFVGSTFNNTQPIFAIRGGSNTFSAIATSKPIVIYVDEIYLPRFSSADFDLFDVERVEVLRGPQGTFFGRNAAAGAIILTTEAPSLDTFEARFSAEVGNLDAYGLRGSLNGPLSDDFAGKLSLSRVERSGYGRDLLSGREQDDLARTSVRGALLWQPNSRFEALLSADYASDRNGGRTLSVIGQGDRNRRTSQLGIDQRFERAIFGGSLRLTYSTPAGDWISITGARLSESDEAFGFSGLNFALLNSGFQQVDHISESPSSLTQEFRFVSTETGTFNFVAGLYLLAEDSNRIVDRERFAAGAGRLIAELRVDQNVETEAYAAYADGTWRLSDTVDLTAGLRYSVETRTASLDFNDAMLPTASFSSSGLDESFDALTPRAALVWRPSEDATYYASATRGFTAGGFNTEADTIEEFSAPFGPETITSYEIGAKFNLSGRRGYLNLAAFHQDYDDKQEFVLTPDTGFGTIVNAAEATLEGVEIEAGWRLNDVVSASLSYGYLDARYDDFRIGDGPGNTGNRLGSSPRHQFALGLEGEWLLLEGRAQLYGRTDISYTDAYFTGATNDPDLLIEGYGLFGGTIGLRSADGGVALELFGSNLLDEDYVLIPSDFVVQSEYLGPPRLYGVRLRLKR